MVPAAGAMLRRVRASQKRMPRFLADAPSRCERLRAEIGQTTDATVLASLWPQKVRPLLEEACGVLAAAVTHGTTLLSVPGKLAKLVGEADSALLLSGQQAEGLPLASLGPVTGLARFAQGEIDRDTFARQYGHRGSHEIELSIPRPAEDPAWIDDQLAALHDTAHDADALLATREAARAAAWERLARQDPKKAAVARKLIPRWAPLARDREAARSEVARSAWVARTWVGVGRPVSAAVRRPESSGAGIAAAFMDAVVIVDPVQYQRRSDATQVPFAASRYTEPSPCPRRAGVAISRRVALSLALLRGLQDRIWPLTCGANDRTL